MTVGSMGGIFFKKRENQITKRSFGFSQSPAPRGRIEETEKERRRRVVVSMDALFNSYDDIRKLGRGRLLPPYIVIWLVPNGESSSDNAVGGRASAPLIGETSPQDCFRCIEVTYC